MRKLLALAITAAAAAAAQAWPTSLIVIPIADILRNREVYLNYAVSGNEQHVDNMTYHAHAVTVGLFDRIEVGYDNDTLGTTIYNAKLLLYEEPSTGKYAVSAGVINWKDGRGDGYLVGRYDFDRVRIHVGWLKNDMNRLMAGLDVDLGSRWGLELSALADFVSGPSSRTWLAPNVNFEKVPGLGIMVGVGFPADKPEGIQYTVSIGYGFKF
ncbi:MAG: hypothetical protein HONBIEJF_00874 [Fimbriimonadaceae bacterium]|nr:hypothetical protein [Fimbriimonadaceae bacterium]